MPIATVAKTTLIFGLFDDSSLIIRLFITYISSEVHDTVQIFGFQELVEPLMDSIELNLIFFSKSLYAKPHHFKPR